MTAQIGAPAPAFELRNTDKSPFSSDSLKGHKTLVVFIPFPFTGTCEDELCMLRDERVRLVGNSGQLVFIQRLPLRWAVCAIRLPTSSALHT